MLKLRNWILKVLNSLVKHQSSTRSTQNSLVKILWYQKREKRSVSLMFIKLDRRNYERALYYLKILDPRRRRRPKVL